MSLHLLSRIIFITLSVSLSPTPAPPTEQLEVGRGRLSLLHSLQPLFLFCHEAKNVMLGVAFTLEGVG